ncbi:MAG: ATP synthase F1 subunit gamma [Bacteroidales bacterium]|nr:ATP synthase F1 subunit gamma [Lachnoclostridium sp.]MCM1384829.1 ATP synthase F1 subunit gamma [Lachnoclostridium sp.]MCM1465822.1 ATP synthase F1 subunit gamma [Bacteroidales bacterium]
MANTREILDRKKSIQDTMKITNAMYMISSTKLRKTKKSLEQTEPYFYTLQNMISRIMRHLPDIKNPYFDKRTEKTGTDRVRGIIIVTADKGLAGAYNHNCLKAALDRMDGTENYKLFLVGEVGRQYFAMRGIPVAEHFHYTAQNPSLHRARIISETVIEQFKRGELDEVDIVYTSMKNGITMETKAMRLLPFETVETEDSEQLSGVAREPLVLKPTPDAVINNIVPDCVMGYVYGALVESFCCEQNARMMSMEAASKNAAAMIHDLSIEYNRARQAMITQEITEVIAGAKAQKKKKEARKEVLSVD